MKSQGRAEVGVKILVHWQNTTRYNVTWGDPFEFSLIPPSGQGGSPRGR